MSSINYMDYNSKRVATAVVSIIFIIFLFSIWHNYYSQTLTENFQGSPPQNYIDLLPGSESDIPKINVENNSFKVSEVKRYFPEFIKKEMSRDSGAIPIEIEVVDENAMVAAAWKVADDLNNKTNSQTKLLNSLKESLNKSKETLEITKEKCKI